MNLVLKTYCFDRAILHCIHICYINYYVYVFRQNGLKNMVLEALWHGTWSLMIMQEFATAKQNTHWWMLFWGPLITRHSNTYIKKSEHMYMINYLIVWQFNLCSKVNHFQDSSACLPIEWRCIWMIVLTFCMDTYFLLKTKCEPLNVSCY